MKPFSQACENNKEAILNTIKPLLSGKQMLLEIGSGTGQHAVHFAKNLPNLIWQTSDRSENHEGINLWIDDGSVENIKRPIELDVLENQWPVPVFDAVYSANTAHIMPWQAVQAFFKGVAEKLMEDGIFILYGPFNYKGEFTSESNKKFDIWLKDIDDERGIRDFEALNQLAEQNKMKLIKDYEMPANNRILVWQKDH